MLYVHVHVDVDVDVDVDVHAHLDVDVDVDVDVACACARNPMPWPLVISCCPCISRDFPTLNAMLTCGVPAAVNELTPEESISWKGRAENSVECYALVSTTL